MVFRVEIAPRALDDLDQIATYIIQKGSFESAEAWFNRIMAAIASLKNYPERCPIAPESEDLGFDVRVLLFGHRRRKYKIYFDIQQKTGVWGLVRVFHVRHWARQQPIPSEFED